MNTQSPFTEQVRIRVPPPPAHLHDPHLWEDALYETAAWPCLEAALGAWCGRVYRWGTEGLYGRYGPRPGQCVQSRPP